jgi:hypothetical protein
MLPPGHLASAFLTAKGISVLYPELDSFNFLFWSSIFAVVPDLDFFYTFFKIKKLRYSADYDHRIFSSHYPIIYFVVSLIGLIFLPKLSLIFITFLIGTTTHFFFDTFSVEGIMWLAPFSKKTFSFSSNQSKYDCTDRTFFRHWLCFAKTYYKKFFIAKIEIILVIISIYFLISDLIKLYV